MTDQKYTPRDARLALQLTQTEMANQVGMSESGYRKWEIGTTEGSGPARRCLELLLEVDRLEVAASKTDYWRKRAEKTEAKRKKKK